MSAARCVCAPTSNQAPCYQGQTHGHEGFLLEPHEAAALLRESQKNREVVFPYFIADELLGNKPPLPGRYVIDFGERDVFAANALQSAV